MIDFATDFAEVLQMVRDAGATVAFRPEAPQGHDPLTETWTSGPPAPTASGMAIEVRGDPETYEQLDLVRMSPVTLIAVPDNPAVLPGLGDTATWAGETRSVRAVRAIRPAGAVLALRVILA